MIETIKACAQRVVFREKIPPELEPDLRVASVLAPSHFSPLTADNHMRMVIESNVHKALNDPKTLSTLRQIVPKIELTEKLQKKLQEREEIIIMSQRISHYELLMITLGAASRIYPVVRHITRQSLEKMPKLETPLGVSLRELHMEIAEKGATYEFTNDFSI